MTDKTIDPCKAIDLIDKFLELYNTKYQKIGSMFENIDIKDPSSTNERMELFYEYMQEHVNLLAENPENIDVYGSDDHIENDDHEIYAIIYGDNAKVKYLSLSFISLLYIGVNEFSEKKWTIVKM